MDQISILAHVVSKFVIVDVVCCHGNRNTGVFDHVPFSVEKE